MNFKELNEWELARYNLKISDRKVKNSLVWGEGEGISDIYKVELQKPLHFGYQLTGETFRPYGIIITLEGAVIFDTWKRKCVSSDMDSVSPGMGLEEGVRAFYREFLDGRRHKTLLYVVK